MGRRGGVAKSEGGAKPAPTEKPKAVWGRWRGGFFAAEFEATLQGFLPAVFSLSRRLAGRLDLVNLTN